MNLAELRRLFVASGAIAAIGALVALIANHFSPLGISLQRDYFPAPASTRPTPVSEKTLLPVAPPQSSASAARLARRGLTIATLAQVTALYRDPRFSAGQIIFIDARDDRHFQAGHIPGAIQLDHYRLDRHVAPVLAASSLAEQIVVYCNGGTCEDSELAAGDLLDLGVPAAKILVYVGGFEEWQRQRLPIAPSPSPAGEWSQP